MCPSASPCSPGAPRSPSLGQDLSQSNPGLSTTNKGPCTFALSCPMHFPTAFPGLSHHTCPHKEYLAANSRASKCPWHRQSSCSKGCSASRSSHEHTGHLPWRWDTSSSKLAEQGCSAGEDRPGCPDYHATPTSPPQGTLPSSTSRAGGNNMSQHHLSNPQTCKGKAPPRAIHEI